MNVKNKDLVKGKEYLVGDIESNLKLRKFLAINSRNNPVFEDPNRDNSYTWGIIKEIEASQHWSLETCPLPPFTVKYKSSGFYLTVVAVSDEYVIAGNCNKSFKELDDNYLYIPDRNNRKLELPCGAVR